MKILGIVCSPRRGGNTEILMHEALGSAQDCGAEVELLTLAGMAVAPCDGCRSCVTTGKCHIDDQMQEIYPKLVEADGLIFGSPVYFRGVTAQAKALIDRTYACRQGRKLRNKVFAVIVVSGRAGGTHAFTSFQDFASVHGMISAAGAMAYARDEDPGPEYRGGGAIAYGLHRGEVRSDERGMAEAKAVGRAVARVISRLTEDGLASRGGE